MKLENSSKERSVFVQLRKKSNFQTSSFQDDFRYKQGFSNWLFEDYDYFIVRFKLGWHLQKLALWNSNFGVS